MILEFLTMLIGTFGRITYELKKESDKYERTAQGFPWRQYINENIFDYIHYVIAGIIALSIKDVVLFFITFDVMKLSNFGMNVLCGIIGPGIYKKLTKHEN